MNIMKGCGLLRSSHRKLAAVLVSILLILSFSSMALLVSAAENSVSLTLYNDSTSASAGSTASYTWKMTENVSNVFRLVVDMDLAQTYKAGELELTINAFDGAGRNTTITRKSFGNETGVFKETSADSSGKIIAVNTAAVNGSASISVTYQFKPEDIKDLGTVNKPLALQCTLKAGKSTVTSNAITFSTDFTQAWSIINSGEHDEAYDEIEVYKPNDSAPLIHKDRLKTIDGVFVDATTVAKSGYYWVEYRVPLLSDDPLGIYKHYIEVKVPDGCIFYSAQTDNEDAQVTPCENLDYTVDSATNTVTVNCADFINHAHSADDTDSYYYFVIALDKSKYDNANAVTFREKHVHKDDASIVGYSENTETIDVPLSEIKEFSPAQTNVFNNGVAKEDFLSGYKRGTTAVPFSLPADKTMKVSSTVPFVTGDKTASLLTRSNLKDSEFSIAAVEIPAHYLNDNGEVIYGINYELYTSSDGTKYSLNKSGNITDDLSVNLQVGVKYAYVLYSPSDKSSTDNFFTYGAGAYSYRASPSFVYRFNVSGETYEKIRNDAVKYVGIAASAVQKDNLLNKNSITNLIAIEKIVKEYRLRCANEADVKVSGNHYEVTSTYGIDFNTNTSQRTFSKFKLVSILPSNYYGNGSDTATVLLNKVKDTLALFENSDDGEEMLPLTVYKKNSDDSVSSIKITADNISKFVTVSAVKKGSNLKIVFDIDFGDYSTLNDGKTNPFLVSYTWQMSRLSESELGSEKTFDMISALYAVGEDSAVPAPADSVLTAAGNFCSAPDDGSFSKTVSSASISKSVLSDANDNGNTTERAYFAKTNISVLDTGETAQVTSIAVKTEYTPFTASTYANPAITRADKEYTLKFSFEGYGSSYSDLVFVSNLGNGNEDGSEWLGTFMSLESVEANFTKDIKAEVYYQISCVNVSKEMENIKDGILFGSTTGDWKKLDADTEVSKVKAIAVKVSSPAISYEDIVSVDLRMKSSVEHANGKYNKVNYGCVAVPLSGSRSTATSDYVVIKQLNPKITYVKRIKADEVNMANGVPTFIVDCGNANTGTSFALAFEKDYNTVNINGIEYYEIVREITKDLDFTHYSSEEKDSLRYGAPHITIEDGGNVSGNTTELELTFDSPEITIVSTSDKMIFNMLSHTALCVNEFDNVVE